MEIGIVPVSLLSRNVSADNLFRYPIEVGMDPATLLDITMIDVTPAPTHVTPCQLQYDMVGEPPEHNQPEYPAADTCNALAKLHIVVISLPCKRE
jgi:hypothetical protein